MQSFTLGIKYLFIDLIGGIIRWPFWWYTSGLRYFLGWAFRTVAGYGQTIGVGVWVKNIFVPMYGQNDWQSRIISFFFRAVNIVGRSLVLLLWSAIILLTVLVYLAIPALTVYYFLYHLLGSYG